MLISASNVAVHSSRFQIEEMVSQDANGAIFLATDSETGREVLLQRFFPFGAGSGGLEGEERDSYQQGVELMKRLEHPALRRVLDGGCDPVDGIPYLISEARVGVSLAEFFASGPLRVEQGRNLVEQALALVIQIESVFGVGADWLVFAADDIEVGGEGETFRFSVDPMKWLGLKKGQGVVKELAATAENALGWAGRIVAGSTMGTLQGWVRTVKAESLSAGQAWDVLQGAAPPSKTLSTAGVTSNPTATAQIKLGQAAPVPFQSPLASAKSGNKALFVWLGSFLAIAALATAGVMLWQQKQKVSESVTSSDTKSKARESKKTTGAESSSKKAVEAKPSSSEEQRRAAITQRALELQSGKNPESAAVSEAKQANEPVRQGAYQPHEIAEFRKLIGSTVRVQGKLLRVARSNSGATIYIDFEVVGDPEVAVRGRYLTKLAKPEMTFDKLLPLMGRNIMLQGEVQVEQPTKRIVINIEAREQITEP